MKRIIFGLVLVVCLLFYFGTYDNEFANDYYDFVNRKFLKHDYLGDDEYIYNNFTLAQDKSDEVRDRVVLDIVEGNINLDNKSDDVKMLYRNVLDMDKRNSLIDTPLKKYIDIINASSNIAEFISNSIMVERELGVDIFTRWDVDRDFLDNNKNIIYLYPVNFAFGSSVDYFVDDDYMAYKAYIKRAIVNLLEKYGMSLSEARLVSSEVISFYEEIGNSSKLSSSYIEVDSYYNVVNRNYLSDIYNKLDIDSYFSDINIDEYSLVDEGQYKKINELLVDDYLMIWKKCVLVKILSSYADYLDMGYRDIVIDLNNNLTGSNESVTLKEDAVDIVSSIFSNEIDKVYEKRVITDSDKIYLENLFNDIKSYFKVILKSNEWLGEETKRKALDKLEVMKVYIGIYDDFYTDIDVGGNSLVENIISINKSSYNNRLDMLEDGDYYMKMSEVDVNAYYDPMSNAVYIPSSVMFLLDDTDSYYERLGTIGMIIAHEITHGFDYNGSKFDSVGNFSNWWNDSDRKNYTKLKNQVIDYYNKIEVMDGKYIDGEATVNENIADMGALKVITGVATKNNCTYDELREMYVSFAKFWRSQQTLEYEKLLLLNDNHSPNKYRVNAVLPLIEEFYYVYDIYPWNKMYVSSNNRVSVW